MASKHQFFELIKPDHNFDFVGKTKPLLVVSALLILFSFAMLPINVAIKSRGHTLNYAIDFRGGTEMRVDFSRPVDPSEVKTVMEAGGFKDSEVVTLPE